MANEEYKKFLQGAKKKPISEHFTLFEVCNSDTALKLNIDNRPTAQVVTNATALCKNVLEKVTGTPVTLFSGVRTEPGVHARNLTVNFLTESQLTPAEFKTVLNQYLPQDIAVLDAVSTPERFRADLNAREITYEYAMDLSPIYDLFHKNYRGRLTDLLSDSLFDLSPEQTAELPNILLMETAAHALLGKHAFFLF